MNSLLVLKPSSVRELADVYRMSPKTFRKWISPFKKDIGPVRGRLLNVLQIVVIVEKVGPPTLDYKT